MLSEPETLALSWEQVDNLVALMAQRFHEQKHAFAGILCLGGGAVVPGRMLQAYFPDCRLFYQGLYSYRGHQQGRLHTFQEMRPSTLKMLQGLGDLLLLVDDIWDTGATFKYGKQLVPKAVATALVSKDQQSNLHLVGITVAPTVWVKFPWEKG